MILITDAKHTTNPAMDLQRAALAICGAMAVYIWYKRYCALSISDVPGPKNPSWIHGISAPLTKSNAIILRTPGQDINGGGNVKKPVSSRRNF